MSFSQLLTGYSKIKSRINAVIAASTSKSTAQEHSLSKAIVELNSRSKCEVVNNEQRLLDMDRSPFFKGIVLLFIIIDDFPLEAIWRTWLQAYHSEIYPEPVKIIIHAKYPDRITKPWVKKHVATSFHYTPSWGSIELTKVMIKLLEEGISTYPEYSHFCFLSESCIPIRSLKDTINEIITSASFSPLTSTLNNTMDDEVINNQHLSESSYLVNHNLSSTTATTTTDTMPVIAYSSVGCSWINYTSEPSNGYSKQYQFQVLEDNHIPPQFIFKSDQWVLLARDHVLALLQLPALLQQSQLFHLFQKVKASDEMFVPTCLAIVGYIPTPSQQPNLSHSNTTTTTLTTTTNDNNNRSNNTKSNNSNNSNSGSGSGSGSGGNNNDNNNNNHQAHQCTKERSPPIVRRRVTYCDWSESPKNPKTFQALTPELLTLALGEGCLFLRKIRPNPNTVENRRDIFLNWILLTSTAAATTSLGVSDISKEDRIRKYESIFESLENEMKEEKMRSYDFHGGAVASYYDIMNIDSNSKQSTLEKHRPQQQQRQQTQPSGSKHLIYNLTDSNLQSHSDVVETTTINPQVLLTASSATAKTANNDLIFNEVDLKTVDNCHSATSGGATTTATAVPPDSLSRNDYQESLPTVSESQIITVDGLISGKRNLVVDSAADRDYKREKRSS